MNTVMSGNSKRINILSHNSTDKTTNLYTGFDYDCASNIDNFGHS